MKSKRRSQSCARIRFGVATLLVAGSLVGVNGGDASAALSSCGTYQNNNSFHAGYYGPGTIPNPYNEGISAYLTIRAAELCGTDTSSSNFSNSYVALGDSDGWGWMQVGFEYTGGYPLRHFGQFYDGNRDPVPGWSIFTRYSVGSPLVGETYYYAVRWAAECNCLRSYINTTVWQSSDFNPWNQVWTPPLHFESVAESRYKANDIPGYSNYGPGPTLHSDVKLMDYAHQWYNLPCGTINHNGNSARWNAASTSCNNLRTYTIGAP